MLTRMHRCLKVTTSLLPSDRLVKNVRRDGPGNEVLFASDLFALLKREDGHKFIASDSFSSYAAVKEPFMRHH